MEGDHNTMTSNQIAYMELAERIRSNAANETEANRHNLAWEGEVHRHNTVTEHQGNLSILEGQRHNLMVERQSLLEIQEAQRRNRAQERLRTQELWEARRHNMAQEVLRRNEMALSHKVALMHDKREGERNKIAKRANQLRAWDTTTRYSLQRSEQRERRRHNKVTESQNWANQGLALAGYGLKLLTAAAVGG